MGAERGPRAAVNLPGVSGPGSGEAPIYELLRRRGTSRYLGVSWNKKDRRWRARISVGGRERCLGQFRKEDEAARAYDAAVRAERGAGAQDDLNFGSAESDADDLDEVALGTAVSGVIHYVHL